MELHRADVLASGSMKLPPEVVEWMLDSWGFVKDSEVYKTKKEVISG